MTSKQRRTVGYTIEGVLYICLIWAAALLLSGCITVEKATNYLDDKGALPLICSTRYPAVTGVADTTFILQTIEDSAAIKALQEELSETKRLLEYVNNLPLVLDSAACVELKQVYFVHLKADEAKYRNWTAQLRAMKDSVMVLTKKVKDSAELKVFINENKALAERATKAEADRDKYTTLAKERGSRLIWIYVVLGIIGAGGIYLAFVKRKYKLVKKVQDVLT